jgi:predicted nucleotidyltransferase
MTKKAAKKPKMEKVKKKSKDEQIKVFGREKYDVAYKFAGELVGKFPELIKSVVLFGSVYKQKDASTSDIDIMVIIDDCSIKLTNMFVNWFNLEVANLIKTIDTRLHVNSVPLTVFWENIKAGEPIAINVLRYGVPLIDMGYFEPLQFLLKKGRIKPTYEAISNAITRAPWHEMRADSKVLNAVIDLHWVMVDSAQAALMKHDIVPPSKEDIPTMLMKTFVKKRKLQKSYVNDFIELYNVAKMIEHGRIGEISGASYDKYKKMSRKFYNKMKKFSGV